MDREADAMKSRRAVDRRLTKLQSSLVKGDITAIEKDLSLGVSSLFLTRFRERKLIMRTPVLARKAVAETLIRMSEGFLAFSELEIFGNYLRFSLAVDAARLRSLEKTHCILRKMPHCSRSDLLLIGETVFEWFAAKVMKGVDVHSIGASVAERERRLHDLNGSLNDVAFAVARAVNEASRISLNETEQRLSKKQREFAILVLRQAARSAGEVNSFEWFFDSVTFGDYVVTKSAEKPFLNFRLDFSDARRDLARTLSIRRKLVLNFTQRRERRYVREKLDDFQDIVLRHAMDFYLNVAEFSGGIHVDLDRARQISKQLLVLIDAEDDLLFAASRFEPKVAAYYLAGIAMRWYALAAKAVRLDPQTRARRVLASPTIPLDRISYSIDDGADGRWATSALQDLTCELPARSHFELLSRPFVKDGLNVARPFLCGASGDWNVIVRESLIQGGTLGKNVGAIWEDFYASCFEGTDWRIVGRSVKLKNGGRVLTDVDLLLLRDDLLLVMQIKALIGSGMTVYDHWKNRQTIELGCAQANIAVEFLKADFKALVSLCGKRDAVRVKHIKPVVLTNIHHFDGWEFDDVPVIGEVTRKAICEGVRVEYFDGSSGEVTHTHHFVKRIDLTTEKILQLLRHPIEFDIAAESSAIQHRIERVGDLVFPIPEFSIRKDLNEPLAHEPSRLKFPTRDRFGSRQVSE